MPHKREEVRDKRRRVMTDRVRVVGDDLPDGGVLFFGDPKLPLLLYKELILNGIAYKYAVDAKRACWEPKSWPGGLSPASHSEVAGRLLANDRRDLLEELDDILKRQSPVDKCPNCGCIVPRNALV